PVAAGRAACWRRPAGPRARRGRSRPMYSAARPRCAGRAWRRRPGRPPGRLRSRRSSRSPGRRPGGFAWPRRVLANAPSARAVLHHALDGPVVDRIGLLVAGVAVLAQRVGPLPGLLIDAAVVVVRAGAHGGRRGAAGQGDGLAVGPQRLGHATGFLEGQTQVAVGLAVVGVLVGGRLVQTDRFVVLTGVVGLLALAIEALGALQPVGAVVGALAD